jgi:release factor glutamine methyltransferase
MIPAHSVPDSLDGRLPWVGRLIGKAMTLSYRLMGRHRYDDFRMERVRGLPFLVIPSVFNPKIPRTGEFLSSLLNAARIDSQCEVLDMGTGSGVCAVFAAKHAAHVVAVDINPAAVRCARINALLNGVEDRIDVRHGDLFDSVAGERFDLIVFNPPFLRGAAQNDRDRAWRSADVAESFAAALSDHLKPGGCALVVLSTFGDARHFLEEFSKRALNIAMVAQRRFVNERLIVFRIAPEGPMPQERT